MRKGLWSPDEDERLVRCITRYVHGSWSDIARRAGLDRCGKSCRRRWMNHLRPDLKRGKFSIDEINLIVQLQETLGNRWSDIASHLEGRTDNDVKNLWNTQIKKRLSQLKAQIIESSFSLPPSIDTTNNPVPHSTSTTSADRLPEKVMQVENSLQLMDASANEDPELINFENNVLAGVMDCSINTDSSCEGLRGGESDCGQENSPAHSEPVSNVSWQSHDNPVHLPCLAESQEYIKIGSANQHELSASNGITTETCPSISRDGFMQSSSCVIEGNIYDNKLCVDANWNFCPHPKAAVLNVPQWSSIEANIQERNVDLQNSPVLSSSMQSMVSCHINSSNEDANAFINASPLPSTVVSLPVDDTVSNEACIPFSSPAEIRAFETLSHQISYDMPETQGLCLSDDLYNICYDNRRLSACSQTFSSSTPLDTHPNKASMQYCHIGADTSMQGIASSCGIINSAPDYIVNQAPFSRHSTLPNDFPDVSIPARAQQSSTNYIQGFENVYAMNGIEDVCAETDMGTPQMWYVPDHSIFLYKAALQAGEQNF